MRRHGRTLVPPPRAAPRTLSGAPEGFDVRLGPLAFAAPIDQVAEAIGDGLEAVGAGIVPAERRPRGVKLALPVRGPDRSNDRRVEGKRLRRQVRQLIDNPRWRLQGFYFVWDPDPEMDCWLLIGSAELAETDPGITFGEFSLQLADVYLAGRPGTHRPGRRAAISHLGVATDGVPFDTRRRLYGSGWADLALPAKPLFLPGDAADLTSTNNRPVVAPGSGPERDGRHLWLAVPAIDGEVFTYRPGAAVGTGRTKYLDLDDPGSVRVWDLADAAAYPPDPAGYDAAGDAAPDVHYGWERVYGSLLADDHPLAVENGVCRMVWLGATGGLAYEYWKASVGHYVRFGAFLSAAGITEQRVIEVTPERAVLEWRVGQLAMRAVLQRGWWGPVLEVYDDGGGEATLDWAAPTSLGALESGDMFTERGFWVLPKGHAAGDEELRMMVAGATAEATGLTGPSVLFPGATHVFHLVGGSTMVATVDRVPGAVSGPSGNVALAGRHVIDARAVPVLVGRS